MPERAGEGRSRDDVWVALNSLPAEFLGFFIKKMKPSYANGILDIMTVPHSDADKDQFIQDWNKALLNSKYAPEKMPQNLSRRGSTERAHQ